MVKSLRWRLQIWQAVILGLVVVGFGTVIYLQIQRSVLEEVDAELLSGAHVLEGVLRTMPTNILEQGVPLPPRPRRDHRPIGPPNAPPPSMRPPHVGPPNGGPPNNRPRDDGPANARPPNPERPFPMQELSAVPDPWNQALRLPLQMRQPEGPPGPLSYFAIYSRDQRVLKAIPSDLASGWVAPRQAIDFRVVESRREVALNGPHGTVIVVGKDIRPQIDRLRWLTIRLVISGVGVLAIGLLGSWWMSGRAIAPIQKINQTAAKINAANLGARIDVQAMDRELRELATILNSMWSRLEQAFEQQVRFTADASHELRTPITVLLSHAELSLARPRSNAEYQETIATSLRAALRMKSLVEDLLVLARADAGKLALRSQPVDLQSIAEEVIAMQQTIAAENNVRLHSDGRAAVANGDPDRLIQVVSNLVANAIRYNHPGGDVVVTTTVEGDDAVLRVRDSGVGISAEDMPHLFERFYRVDEARSRDSGGSGLGLAICQSIVQAHRGTIDVQSEPGIGSTFEIRLPRGGG